MIEISKKTVIKILVIVVCFILCFFTGYIRGCIHGRGSSTDEATLNIDESIITDVTDIASNIQQGISGTQKQVNNARTELKQGITSIGEIGQSTDRITTELLQSEQYITDIEYRISAITELIDKATEKNEVLESNGWG